MRFVHAHELPSPLSIPIVINMSIWDGVARVGFEARVMKLAKIAPSQQPDGPIAPRNRAPGPNTENNDLPSSVEKQLSDNFAFFAAWEESPDCVAAATVLKLGNQPGLIITLSANEGIANAVTDSITRILNELKSCAQQCK